MNAITAENSSVVWARFNGFNDAVIRKIEIAYSADGLRAVTALVAARDAEQSSNDGWSLVSLRVSGVKRLRFYEEEKTSAQVLSNGVHIVWFDALVGLEFGDCIDAPESLDELQGSQLFTLGDELHFSVREYET